MGGCLLLSNGRAGLMEKNGPSKIIKRKKQWNIQRNVRLDLVYTISEMSVLGKEQ